MTSYENERRDAQIDMPVLPSAARSIHGDVEDLPGVRTNDDAYQECRWVDPIPAQPAFFTSARTGVPGGSGVAKGATVLAEADSLIYGDRAAEYGPAFNEARCIATGWEVILGLPAGSIKDTAPALCMAWLKITRELNKHKRDNLVDAAGYIGLAQKVLDGD